MCVVVHFHVLEQQQQQQQQCTFALTIITIAAAHLFCFVLLCFWLLRIHSTLTAPLRLGSVGLVKKMERRQALRTFLTPSSPSISKAVPGTACGQKRVE